MVATGARAENTATRCEACGWPYDDEALVTGDCALCAPHDPEPHVSWRHGTTVKLVIVVTGLLLGLMGVVLFVQGLARG